MQHGEKEGEATAATIEQEESKLGRIEQSMMMVDGDLRGLVAKKSCTEKGSSAVAL